MFIRTDSASSECVRKCRTTLLWNTRENKSKAKSQVGTGLFLIVLLHIKQNDICPSHRSTQTEFLHVRLGISRCFTQCGSYVMTLKKIRHHEKSKQEMELRQTMNFANKFTFIIFCVISLTLKLYMDV